MKNILLCALIAACGSPSYTTERFNISVYDDTTGNKMDSRSKQVDDIAGLLVANYCGCHEAVKKLDGLKVYFQDGKVECGEDEFGGCANLDEGWYDGSSFLTVQWADCLPISVFGHELVHYFEWEIHKRDDLKHSNSRFWGTWGVVNSTVVSGVEVMCPEIGD